MSDHNEALEVDHDNLVSHLSAWAAGEKTAAASAAERRSEIGQFLEDHPGLHKKALSDIRRINKMDEEKRDDYFRSFDKLRDVLEMNWKGQSTPDIFEDGGKATEPAGEEIPPFDGEEIPV